MFQYVLPKNPHEHSLFRDYKRCAGLYATECCKQLEFCCVGSDLLPVPENAKTPPVLAHRERLDRSGSPGR